MAFTSLNRSTFEIFLFALRLMALNLAPLLVLPAIHSPSSMVLLWPNPINTVVWLRVSNMLQLQDWTSRMRLTRLLNSCMPPTDAHWGAVKGIICYLKGTIHHGLHIHASSSFDLHAYSDADWARCLDDRRSTTGFCTFLGSNLLSWGSKKQHTVSQSSTEAEYRSMAIACAELIWIQHLLCELHAPLLSKLSLWCDNLGVTFLASNHVFHAHAKHIEINYHFMCT